MKLIEAYKLAQEYGLIISRQGLASAALAHLFVHREPNGKLDYKEDGVLKYIQIRTDKHPHLYLFNFEEYTATVTTVLTVFVKHNIPYQRYGACYLVFKDDRKRVEQLLSRYKKNGNN